MSVRAKVLKVPWLASFILYALAHSLTMRVRSAKRGSTRDRWRSTVDLNLAPPLPTAMSHGISVATRRQDFGVLLGLEIWIIVRVYLPT